MPSTTTYLEMVNKVLRACGTPSCSAADFASPAGANNAREIRQAKEIVAEVYAELQNDRPDSWWHRVTEIKILKPFNEGGVIEIPSADPTTVDFAFDGALDFDDVPWIGAGAALPTPGTFLHIQGERQYYRVSLKQSATRLKLVTGNIDHVGYNDPLRPIGYTLFKRTYDLPADFGDILNVYNEYVGTDVRPMGSERMVENMVAAGVLETSAGSGGFGSDPELYAIHRPDGGGAPVLLIHPVPSEDRVLTVRYRKRATIPTLAADTFELDQDHTTWLLNMCKARAALEISRNPDEYAIYMREAKMGQQLAQQKSMESGGDFQRIRPTVGEDYRGHYSTRGLRDGRRNIILGR